MNRSYLQFIFLQKTFLRYSLLLGLPLTRHLYVLLCSFSLYVRRMSIYMGSKHIHEQGVTNFRPCCLAHTRALAEGERLERATSVRQKVVVFHSAVIENHSKQVGNRSKCNENGLTDSSMVQQQCEINQTNKGWMYTQHVRRLAHHLGNIRF